MTDDQLTLDDIGPKETAPYVPGSDTSKQASRGIERALGRLQETVLEYVAACGPHGTTCDQAEVALNMKHQTCSARIKELRDKGRIVDGGERRLTTSGRKAVVYVMNNEKEMK